MKEWDGSIREWLLELSFGLSLSLTMMLDIATTQTLSSRNNPTPPGSIIPCLASSLDAFFYPSFLHFDFSSVYPPLYISRRICCQWILRPIDLPKAKAENRSLLDPCFLSPTQLRFIISPGALRLSHPTFPTVLSSCLANPSVRLSHSFFVPYLIGLVRNSRSMPTPAIPSMERVSALIQFDFQVLCYSFFV